MAAVGTHLDLSQPPHTRSAVGRLRIALVASGSSPIGPNENPTNELEAKIWEIANWFVDTGHSIRVVNIKGSTGAADSINDFRPDFVHVIHHHEPPLLLAQIICPHIAVTSSEVRESFCAGGTFNIFCTSITTQNLYVAAGVQRNRVHLLLFEDIDRSLTTMTEWIHTLKPINVVDELMWDIMAVAARSLAHSPSAGPVVEVPIPVPASLPALASVPAPAVDQIAPSAAALVQMPITIVTCLFKIAHSKHSDDDYRTWATLFLSLPAAMVIFVDAHWAPFVRTQRAPYEKQTHIIETRLPDLKMYSQMDFWSRCHAMDPEQKYNHPELYLLWNQKTWFVEEAIKKDPFKSDWFYWSDMGVCRKSEEMSLIQTFPSIDTIKKLKMPADRLCVISIEPIRPTDYAMNEKSGIYEIMRNVNADGKEWGCAPFVRIEGGFFGGQKAAWNRWHSAYEKELELLKTHNTFAGKDQYVMLAIALRSPELVTVLHADTLNAPTGSDPWFAFRFHFS